MSKRLRTKSVTIARLLSRLSVAPGRTCLLLDRHSSLFYGRVPGRSPLPRWAGRRWPIVAQCTPERPGHGVCEEPTGLLASSSQVERQARPWKEWTSHAGTLFAHFHGVRAACRRDRGLVAFALATSSSARRRGRPPGRDDHDDGAGAGVEYDKATESPIPLDALYILDYKGGRLLATVPTFRQSTGSTTIIESFVERDLAADFKLDLDAGPHPALSHDNRIAWPIHGGWAPLYVIETTSNQIGVYRLHLQETTGKSADPKFELVQIRSYAKAAITAASSRAEEQHASRRAVGSNRRSRRSRGRRAGLVHLRRLLRPLLGRCCLVDCPRRQLSSPRTDPSPYGLHCSCSSSHSALGSKTFTRPPCPYVRYGSRRPAPMLRENGARLILKEPQPQMIEP